MIDQTPIEPEDKELDVLVRDLTKAHPLPKSEVKARVLAWADQRIKLPEKPDYMSSPELQRRFPNRFNPGYYAAIDEVKRLNNI